MGNRLAGVSRRHQSQGVRTAGEWVPCNASPGRCPRAGEGNHLYLSSKEAEEYDQLSVAKEFGKEFNVPFTTRQQDRLEELGKLSENRKGMIKGPDVIDKDFIKNLDERGELEDWASRTKENFDNFIARNIAEINEDGFSKLTAIDVSDFLLRAKEDDAAKDTSFLDGSDTRLQHYLSIAERVTKAKTDEKGIAVLRGEQNFHEAPVALSEATNGKINMKELNDSYLSLTLEMNDDMLYMDHPEKNFTTDDFAPETKEAVAKHIHYVLNDKQTIIAKGIQKTSYDWRSLSAALFLETSNYDHGFDDKHFGKDGEEKLRETVRKSELFEKSLVVGDDDLLYLE